MPYKLEDLQFPGLDRPFGAASKPSNNKAPKKSGVLDLLKSKEEKEEIPIATPKPKKVKKEDKVAKTTTKTVEKDTAIQEEDHMEELMRKILKRSMENDAAEEMTTEETEMEEPEEEVFEGECVCQTPEVKGFGNAVEKTKDLLKITILVLVAGVAVALVIRGIQFLFSI